MGMDETRMRLVGLADGDPEIKRGFKMAMKGIKGVWRDKARIHNGGWGDKTPIHGLNVHEGIKHSLEDKCTDDKSIQTWNTVIYFVFFAHNPYKTSR